MFQVVADGIAWVDADGCDSWPACEADTLAAGLERIGYVVVVVPA